MTSDSDGQEIFGGIALVSLADEVRELSKKDFVAQYTDPYLLFDVPEPDEVPLRRQFKTLMVEDKNRKLAKLGEEKVLVAIVKRDVKGAANLVTIGRTRAADIVLDHAVISKLHAYFSRDAVSGAISIADAGSANGTTLNGKTLEARQPVRIKEGGRVVFGTRFRAEYLTPAALYKLVRKHC